MDPHLSVIFEFYFFNSSARFLRNYDGRATEKIHYGQTPMRPKEQIMYICMLNL